MVDNSVCPNCGYCPHCGRARQAAPYYPYYPYSPWVQPWPWGGPWYTGGTVSIPSMWDSDTPTISWTTEVAGTATNIDPSVPWSYT